MTVPRLLAFIDHWREEPPVHNLVAAFIGYKPKRRGNLIDLVNMFASGVISANPADMTPRNDRR